MTQLEQKALDFVRNLQHLYYEKRDLPGILEGFHPQFSWIGVGEWEICKHNQDTNKALAYDISDCPTGFCLSNCWYEPVTVSDTICMVYGGLSVAPENNTMPPTDQRFSALCVQIENEMKLLHIHVSCPDYRLQQGNFMKTDNMALRNLIESTAKDLESKNQELLDFTENVPAGMLRCLHDGGFTILSASESFLSLCGYTNQELSEYFQNQFVCMVHESDKDKLNRECQMQLHHGESIEMDFRLVRKGGAVLWVMFRAKMIEDAYGEQILYTLLVDITKRKQEQEELRLSLEHHQIVINQAADIIFEWDIYEDKLILSPNWEKKFGYRARAESASFMIPISHNIYKDDIPHFLKIMDDIKAGVPYSETEIRIRQRNKNYIWCRVRATTQFDEHKTPVRAIGVITDIDAVKQYEQALINQAQNDPLTGLYHKAAVQNHVCEHIRCCKKDEKGAILIIDIDYFKRINDNYGHLCGDAILANAGAVLKKLFRATDVIGRVGGDEFFVYMKNISTRESVAEKARDIHKAFGKIVVQDDSETGIQCSIGIALFPENAQDYVGLYKCADNALYYVKKNGRGNFAFYDATSQSGASFFTAEGLDAPHDGSIVSSDGIDEALTQYIFKMLFDAVDIKMAVRQLLEIVGMAYDVSRVYIFENTEDDQRCNNTFEWCGEGIEPEIEKLQGISYADDLDGFWDNFDENGIFYCQDICKLSPNLYKILAAQNITSVLQCAIIDEGKYRGFVGFDECRTNRYWTKHQIRSLSVIANVLSAFLLKLRLKEKLERLEHKKI